VQEPNKSGFNWWAFIFGPFWYFYKGLWGKGLLLFLVAIVASSMTFFIFGPRRLSRLDLGSGESQRRLLHLLAWAATGPWQYPDAGKRSPGAATASGLTMR